MPTYYYVYETQALIEIVTHISATTWKTRVVGTIVLIRNEKKRTSQKRGTNLFPLPPTWPLGHLKGA